LLKLEVKEKKQSLSVNHNASPLDVLLHCDLDEPRATAIPELIYRKANLGIVIVDPLDGTDDHAKRFPGHIGIAKVTQMNFMLGIGANHLVVANRK